MRWKEAIWVILTALRCIGLHLSLQLITLHTLEDTLDWISQHTQFNQRGMPSCSPEHLMSTVFSGKVYNWVVYCILDIYSGLTERNEKDHSTVYVCSKIFKSYFEGWMEKSSTEVCVRFKPTWSSKLTRIWLVHGVVTVFWYVERGRGVCITVWRVCLKVIIWAVLRQSWYPTMSKVIWNKT